MVYIVFEDNHMVIHHMMYYNLMKADCIQKYRIQYYQNKIILILSFIKAMVYNEFSQLSGIEKVTCLLFLLSKNVLVQLFISGW